MTEPFDPFAEGEIDFEGDNPTPPAPTTSTAPQPQRAPKHETPDVTQDADATAADNAVHATAEDFATDNDEDPYQFGEETDNAFDDYDFNDLTSDEPADWEPPVAPPKSAARQFSGTTNPTPPPRTAKPAKRTTVINFGNSSDFVEPVSPKTGKPIAVAQPTGPVTPKSKPHTTPQVEQTPKRGFTQRILDMFGKKAVGPTEEELRSIRRRVDGAVNVAFVTRKGGVGKTVAAAGVGMTLASQRGDRVIAIDASPDGGELSDRVSREQDGSVRSLLDQLGSVSRYSHVRAHTSQDASGLEVLGSNPNQVGDKPLTGDEYREMMGVLRNFYNVILTDCAQGLGGELMDAVLTEADVLVLVSEGADGMRAATWVVNELIDANGRFQGRHSRLIDDLVVVVNQRSPKSNVDVNKVAEHFSTITPRVCTVPYDQVLEGGRAVRLGELNPDTQQAFLTAAAHIAGSAPFREGGR